MRTSNWDSLEKALTVFRLPGKPHRRVDLIFAAPEVYWTAVVGWCAKLLMLDIVVCSRTCVSDRSGSTMFERDLRLYAKQEKLVTIITKPSKHLTKSL